ncbi:hypothetical protein RND71_016127 [Anisodus tanguticus]|uniref:Protein kinase domain-containing protein n=1 Tax=Anisodus tanguticus TaxID=243964 RepID=A0AAE1S5K2_9SOLA|nr:hypothetical protein RND71_016127 [Anisodus tanguticus]
MDVLYRIDLSANKPSGEIPSCLGDLSSLGEHLYSNALSSIIPPSFWSTNKDISILRLSSNFLNGSLPLGIGSVRSLSILDLSRNQFSGEIPSTMGQLQNLVSLSLSMNNFEGLIPQSFGDLRISYYEVVRGTNNFDEANLIGRGGLGLVYRGTLQAENIVAVKVFNTEVQDAFRGFDLECEVLRNIRHRNLVKVISSCANLDFKALVLEYMPNGDLDYWLYSHNNFLDLNRRLKAMIDVASAMEYLHEGHSFVVIHCDLKPSNILLDEDMVARVSVLVYQNL